ncbi:MAG TPA: EAL domain-containing protein [Steroidobacteraceae bacterium]|nr:EAL domain-containing protein [Steroidobacteraceae bacterium]
MTGAYNPWLVCLSIIVAIFVSHTALRLSARVAESSGKPSARLWLIGGAVSMGCGIWSMHFVGMLAFSLPIALSYDINTTLVSLTIAIALSGFALAITSRARLSCPRLAIAALVMGIGICAMHYTGMAAIQIFPTISYVRGLLVASFVIAVGASYAALWLFFRLRTGSSWLIRLKRLGAATLMGSAISGMHYTGMAATRFAAGSYCTSHAAANNSWLAVTIALVALAVLAITTVMLLYEAHLDSEIHRHNELLQDANAQLQHAANHDPLTGLPNRLLLEERLRLAIANAQSRGTRFAVLIIDLDRFKSINDSLGHLSGDSMLQEVGTRLVGLLRAPDTVARLGGDEFVVLIADVLRLPDVERIAARILAEIARPLTLSGLEIHISASVGISVWPDDGTDAASMLRHADAAMYHAKKSGCNMHQFFAPRMNAFTRERLELENGLRRALSQGELVLHYQPKVNVRNGRIEGAEALIRWEHPTRGLIGPGEFIPLAEESGLILPIGEWVLTEACKQAYGWQVAGLRPACVAVNLSVQQFRQRDLVAIVRRALRTARLHPHQLEIELTESTVMQDAEQSIAALRELSELGVRIAVDDFGTGYSSLSYLRRLPLDSLKIDRTFIRELVTSRDDAAIVRAIMSLAHSLHLGVVAEGVETAEQLDFLREIDCDQYQGYYYSPPLSSNGFVALVREQPRARPEHRPLEFPDTLVARALQVV